MEKMGDKTATNGLPAFVVNIILFFLMLIFPVSLAIKFLKAS